MKKGIIIGLIGAAAVIAGVLVLAINLQNNRAAYSVSVIGGADGPTSVFIAGKIGGNKPETNMEAEMSYKQITQEQAKAIMDEKTNDAIVVDVRRPDEYAEGHIENAINIPNERIIDTPPVELSDMDKLILVYCRSGRRSKEASQKLANMGYTNINEFGGILEWPYEIVK